MKQNGPVTYLVKVREDQVWKRHIDHVHQMEGTTKELLESNERSVDSDITENEFTDTTVADDDLLMTFQRLTETVTEPVATDTRRYPQRTHQPPDHLVCQDTV